MGWPRRAGERFTGAGCPLDGSPWRLAGSRSTSTGSPTRPSTIAPWRTLGAPSSCGRPSGRRGRVGSLWCGRATWGSTFSPSWRHREHTPDTGDGRGRRWSSMTSSMQLPSSRSEPRGSSEAHPTPRHAGRAGWSDGRARGSTRPACPASLGWRSPRQAL